MKKKPKYLYTDGISKGEENLMFFILDGKAPLGPLSQQDKVTFNPVCDTLDRVLSHLQEAEYQTPLESDVRNAIHLAFQEGLDYISITIPPK